MKNVRIIPSTLNGEIIIPPSKSISHRAIICAGLADGISRIENIIFSDDITATLEGMKSFGVEVRDIINKKNEAKTAIINGTSKVNLVNEIIDCKESGSTLRFLIPMAGLIGANVIYLGRGRLVERPLDTYYKLFDNQNIKYKNNNGKLPLSIDGLLKPGDYKIKGNISSQFITGLMFVLPLLHGDSNIIITTDLESKGYVDLTIDVLSKFGIKIENNDYKNFYIKGNQKYKKQDYYVEGDFSQSAFWITAGLLGTNIKAAGLNVDSLQGDKEVIDIIKKMGGNISIKNGFIETKESKTNGIEIDVAQCPDLVPIITTLGALSQGVTKITNAERLRIKESDRLKAVTTELNKLGADITELKDGLVIRGKEKLKGGIVDSWNDHRIAMSLAIASIKCEEEVIIKNSNSVNKSYPNFWEDFTKLGGKVYEWNMG